MCRLPHATIVLLGSIAAACCGCAGSTSDGTRACSCGLSEAALLDLDRWLARPTHLSQLLPPHLVLVRAKVVDICPSEFNARLYLDAQLRILDVYYGPAGIKNESFVATFAPKQPQGSTPLPHYPPPTISETGIWLLQFYHPGPYGMGPRSAGLHDTRRGIYGVPLPARDPSDPEYALAERFGETLRELSALDEHERVRRLQELALGRTPGLDIWAIHALAEQRPAAARRFLEGLPEDEQLTLRAQVALDRVLLRLDEPGWPLHQGLQHHDERGWWESPRRLAMFQRWVSSGLSEEDGLWAANHLNVIAQHPSAVDEWQQDILPLVRTALSNERLPFRVRRFSLVIVSTFGLKRRGRHDGADTPSFNFLVDVIKSATEPELRRDAADYVCRKFSLDLDPRRAEVIGLIESSDDEEVKRLLAEALRAADTTQ